MRKLRFYLHTFLNIFLILAIVTISTLVNTHFILSDDEWVSEDDGWIKNEDDTWSYTFDVFDESKTYYFWEEEIPGYENDINSIPGYKILDGSKENVGYITNRSMEEYGSLDIYKFVEWITEKDTTSKFEFIITLSGDNISGTQVFSDIIFKDGVGKLQIKDGEHKLISLPAGVSYNIIENVESSSFALQEKLNDSGIITAGEVTQVIFKNREVAKPKGSLKITKKVDGAKNINDKYKIYIYLNNLEANAIYDLGHEKMTTFTKYSHTENITDDGIRDGNFTSKIIHDVISIPGSNKLHIEVKVGTDATYSAEQLNIIKGEEPYSTNISLPYNSNRVVLASLRGTTYLNSPAVYDVDADTVTFRFATSRSAYQLSNYDRYGYCYGYYAVITGEAPVFVKDDSFKSDNEGNAVIEYEISNNETLIINNLPENSSYQVVETSGNYTSSYEMLSDKNDHIITEYNEDENEELVTVKKELLEDETAQIVITNMYKKYQNLKIRKIVNGVDEDKKQYFRFEIRFSNLDPAYTINSTAGKITADVNGEAIKNFYLTDNDEAIFDDVPVGTEYMVTELANNCYSSFIVTSDDIVLNKKDNVEIREDLSTNLEIVNEDEDVVVTFTNTSEVGLTLEKIVDGNMGNKTDEFDFLIRVINDQANDNSDIVVDESNNALSNFSLIKKVHAYDSQVHASGTYDDVSWKIVELADGSKQLQLGESGATQIFSSRNRGSQQAADWPWNNTTYNGAYDSIVFLGTVKGNGSMQRFFQGSLAKTIDLTNYDNSDATSTFRMFSQMTNLESIDITGFNSSKVTKFSSMFQGNSNLVEIIGLTSLDTSKASGSTSMDNVFNGCDKLIELDLSSFDTSTTGDMANFFPNSANLRTVKLGPNFRFDGYGGIANKALLPGDSETWMLVGSDPAIEKTAVDLRDEWASNASIWAGTWTLDKEDNNIEEPDENYYVNLSKYGGIYVSDGFYKFTLSSGDVTPKIKVPYGYKYEISEVDYSSEGYRTYVGNSIIPGNQTSDTLLKDTNVLFRNIRGAAVPTEIRFYWWAGSIPVLLAAIWFVYMKKKRLSKGCYI